MLLLKVKVNRCIKFAIARAANKSKSRIKVTVKKSFPGSSSSSHSQSTGDDSGRMCVKNNRQHAKQENFSEPRASVDLRILLFCPGFSLIAGVRARAVWPRGTPRALFAARGKPAALAGQNRPQTRALQNTETPSDIV